MTTIARLTVATLFGHRRGLLMFLLPAALLGLAVLLRLTLDDTESFTVRLLQQLAFAVILPLVALVAGTGVIASEIDDGSIVYLLSKPVRRHTIVLTKTAVAVACVTVFGAVPVVVTGLLLAPSEPRIALGFGLGALLAGIAYAAVFIALSVLTRNAVTVGLLYALVWEGVIGQYVAGAKVLSIQQWGLVVVETVSSGGDPQTPGVVGGNQIDAAVNLPVGVVGLAAVLVLALVLAVTRLRSLVLSSAE
jgi:ABC-2 type transport system permease protein